jgi:hypothetical protein
VVYILIIFKIILCLCLYDAIYTRYYVLLIVEQRTTTNYLPHSDSDSSSSTPLGSHHTH